MKQGISVLPVLSILIWGGCGLFEKLSEDCDHAPEVFDGGELFSDRGECNFVASPGYPVRLEIAFDYGAVAGRQTNFNWTFSSDDLYLADTGEQIVKEYTNTTPGILVYSRRRDDLTQVSIQIEVVASNECGKSNPYKGTLTVYHKPTAAFGLVDYNYPALPSAVRHHGQAYYKGDLYVLFGERNDAGKTNYKYNFVSKQWAEVPAPANTPIYLYTHQYRQVQLDNNVYFIHNHGYQNNTQPHYVYNLDNHTLQTLPELPGIADYPTTFVHHGVWPVVYQGKIIVGPYYHGIQNQYAIAELNPETHEWVIEHFIDAALHPDPLIILGAPYPDTRNFGEMAIVFDDVLLYRFEKAKGWYSYNFSSKSGVVSSTAHLLTGSASGVSSFVVQNKAYLLTGSDYGAGQFKALYSVSYPMSGESGLTEKLLLQGTGCYSKSWFANTYGARVTVAEGVPYYVVENGMVRLSIE